MPTSKPSAIDSVNGMRTVIVVPWPGCVAISTEPRRASISRLTTSIPTPRPETSVRVLAVDSRCEDKLKRFALAQFLRPVDDVLLPRGLDHPFDVDASAIVTHFNDDQPGLVVSGERDRAFRRFSLGLTLVRKFDPVVQRISDQVLQRPADLLCDLLVHFGFAADDGEANTLTDVVAIVANQAL